MVLPIPYRLSQGAGPLLRAPLFRGKSVSPSTALAVSPLEFIFAYIAAFGPGMVLLKPSRATLQASLVVVMGHNLLMHFPPVEEAPGGCLASLSARRTT